MFDTIGHLEPILAALRILLEQWARETATASFGVDLNALYRSLTAWRRGDELGGRLQARHLGRLRPAGDDLSTVRYAS